MNIAASSRARQAPRQSYRDRYGMLDHNRMRDWIHGTIEETNDNELAYRLCHLWVYGMLSGIYGFDIDQEHAEFRSRLRNHFSSSPGDTFMTLLGMCKMESAENINNVFSIIHHARPTGVRGHRFKGGKSMNFNVGASFSLKFGEGLDSDLSASFNPLSAIKGKLGTLFGIASVKTGWKASISRDMGQGSSVSSGTYLAMQKAKMDLYFDGYESCMEMRMRPSFVLQRIALSSRDFLPQEYHDEWAHRGLYICSGELRNGITPFTEMYYYFTQHFTEGDMLDSGDLKNHPWLLSLRGERNYTHFVDLIKATPEAHLHSQDFDPRWIPNNVLQKYLNNGHQIQSIGREVDLSRLPLDQLIEAYHLVPPPPAGVHIITPRGLDYPLD